MKSIFKRGKIAKIICGCIVTVLCCTLLSSCSIARNSAKLRAIKCFQSNYELFEQLANRSRETRKGVLIDLAGLSSTLQIDVPESLIVAGIGEIYASGGNTYFECTQTIMGVTPCGIVYVTDADEIDEWYKIELIENDWYYYRIVS